MRYLPQEFILKNMFKKYGPLITCIFCVVAYVMFTLMVLNTLGQVNQVVKEVIYQHYNVPLADK